MGSSARCPNPYCEDGMVTTGETTTTKPYRVPCQHPDCPSRVREVPGSPTPGEDEVVIYECEKGHRSLRRSVIPGKVGSCPEGWPLCGLPRTAVLYRRARAGSPSEDRNCPGCGGDGMLWKPEGNVECPACRGTGHAAREDGLREAAARVIALRGGEAGSYQREQFVEALDALRAALSPGSEEE